MSDRGFSLIECLLVIAIVALVVTFAQPSFHHFNLTMRANADRSALRRYLKDIRTRALFTTTRYELRIDPSQRLLSCYEGDTRLQVWRVSRQDCTIFWHGMLPNLRFEANFLSNRSSGRLSYQCREPVGEFTWCFTRFGLFDKCSDAAAT